MSQASKIHSEVEAIARKNSVGGYWAQIMIPESGHVHEA